MINADDMFRTFQPLREDALVIVTGTAGKHWADHTTKLGLALGLPDEKVVLFDSEGALLMNLGIIATIAGQAPKNFVHLLMDNECYATTGGQPVPNAQDINYAGMAKEAGYAAAYSFDNIEDFATNIGKIMQETGPVFVAMKIVPEVENEPIGQRTRRPSRSRAETIRTLREELGIS